MRIVVWNAHQALYRKQDALAHLRPDIAVIPECGDRLDARDGRFLWVGKNHSKGLGVFAYGDYRLTRLARSPGLKWALPVKVTGPHDFFLLALWNMPPYDYDLRAVDAYHRLLMSRGGAVIAGDFNVTPDMYRADAEWDYGDPAWQKDANFFLGDLPSVSAYHKFTHEAPGAETKATHYWLYRRTSRFHFDYCFIPRSWRVNQVRVGTFDSWVQDGLSDHVPVMVDVCPRARLPRSRAA